MNIQIIGTPIFKDGNLLVANHELGYTITNGKKLIVTEEMPCLCSNHLSKMLGFTSSKHQTNPLVNNITKQLDAQIISIMDDCLNY